MREKISILLFVVVFVVFDMFCFVVLVISVLKLQRAAAVYLKPRIQFSGALTLSQN